MTRNYSYRILGLFAFLTLGLSANAQNIMAALSTPDSLDHFEIGEAAADDYGALPYGDGHLLFVSNREEGASRIKDPNTNKPFARPYLLRIKDLKTLPFPLPNALKQQKYYIGLCALLPDSSGIIASHSRTKPYANGTVGMTLSYFPFNGDKAKELPFIDINADYQHPFFDPVDYTLYFTSNAEGGKGGYDLYSSSYSFDGTWSTPAPITEVNTNADEVFPSVGPGQALFFSRASRNYGLQGYSYTPSDSTLTELATNGRGDDFGLIILNDSTALMSQSKRPGSSANLHLYKLTKPTMDDPAPLAEKASEESIDSVALAIAKADSIAAFNSSETAMASQENDAKDSKTWTTDNSPEPGTTSGFSIIVGGFVERDLADNFLESISGWAPEAFLSRYNKKYYVVHSVHKNREDAEKAKASVNNRDYRAWVLSKGLIEI